MKIDFEHVFNYAEVRSTYLKEIVEQVLNQVSKHIDYEQMEFGNLIEGRTFSGEAGEVTEDGDIHLDSDKLLNYEKDVAMALIAHEFAHYNLGHFRDKRTNTLVLEEEADQLAKDWGFKIDAFRKICGPPICDERQ